MSGERGERDVLEEWEEMKADERKYRLTGDHEWYQDIALRLATELRAARAERDALRWARDQAIQAWEVTVAENDALRAERDALQEKLAEWILQSDIHKSRADQLRKTILGTQTLEEARARTDERSER